MTKFDLEKKKQEESTFVFVSSSFRAITLNNSVYVIGGRYASTGRLSSSVFKYDAETDSWRVCDSMKAPRYVLCFQFEKETVKSIFLIIFFFAVSILQ